jgi:hypothetical protein
MTGNCSNSLFGPRSQFIKINGGDLIAIEGSNVKEKLILSDLRIPYKQVLKGRIILKPGQKNYLLNHLGLGDNATFLSIKVSYDSKSVISENNYIEYIYDNDLFRTFTFTQILTLSGNSEKRIPQLYLNNPNQNYSVNLDVMVAIIDDENSYFSNQVQNGLTLIDIKYTDIITHVVDESISIMGNILNFSDITSIERLGRIILMVSNKGKIFIEFISEYDAKQGHSIINWAMNGIGRNIQDLETLADIFIPIIYFTDMIYLLDVDYDGPYNTTQGDNFKCDIDLDNYNYSPITKEILISLLIDKVEDNRDGILEIKIDDIKLYNQNLEISEIIEPGTYKIYFNFNDIAGNMIESIENITITVI